MSRAADSSSPEPAATPAAAQPSSQAASRPPRLALLIATGFGLGYLPKAPGTWGSLAGVAIGACFLKFWPPDIAFALFSATTIDFTDASRLLVFAIGMIGVFAAGEIAEKTGERDPGFVVIDEISGQVFVIVFFAVQSTFDVTGIYDSFSGGFWHGIVSWKYLLAGFILFRVFDIWKPWPVRAAEKLPGGWGIMADDWVAGIYAALCLWALRAVGL